MIEFRDAKLPSIQYPEARELFYVRVRLFDDLGLDWACAYAHSYEHS